MARFLDPERGGVNKAILKDGAPLGPHTLDTLDDTARTDCVSEAKNGSRNEVNGAGVPPVFDPLVMRVLG